MVKALSFILIFIFACVGHARVFHLNKQTAGTYIQGTGGTSLLGNTVYNRNDVIIENKVMYQASGEFGLMFKASSAWIRTGIEIIRPQLIEGAVAKDSGGQELYRIDSGILAFGPVLNIELPFGTFERARFFITGGGGYMKVTTKNDYKFTAIGNTTYSLSDYTVEATSYALMGQGGLGMEVMLADASTFILSAGYRHLVAYGLQHERPNSTLGGHVDAGDIMEDADGNKLVLNMSGYWVGVGFRFYWNF